VTTYAWPAGWTPSRWEMRVIPNTRIYASPYSQQVQVADLLGEMLSMKFDLPPTTDEVLGSAREAFFDRLKGPLNTVQIGNLKRPVPLGTMRDGVSAGWLNNASAAATWKNASVVTATWVAGRPAVRGALAQFANSIPITTLPGRTMRAGDCIGVNGQLVRVMADAVADGTGTLTVEVMPRMRTAVAAYSAVTWNAPTATMMLKGDGVPTPWMPGYADGASIELIESIS
jgi:hypothetical protein